MTVQSSLIAFISGILGVTIGAAITRLSNDDEIKTKHLIVVDDDGKSWVDVSDAGISVYGEKKGDFSQIRAGDSPAITFSEGGTQRVAAGVLNYQNFAGFVTYDEGAFKTVIGSSGGTSAMALYAGQDQKASENILDGHLKSLSAIRMYAKDDETSEMLLFGKKGGSKTIGNGSGTSQLEERKR